jgi:hypothetical protein
MGRLQNNPSIEWVQPKSTHVNPLTWGNKKMEENELFHNSFYNNKSNACNSHVHKTHQLHTYRDFHSKKHNMTLNLMAS